MNDQNDPFKDFITKNTSENLNKPTNEYSEILKKIEPKKSFFNLYKWAISGFVTACLILSVGIFAQRNTETQNFDDDEIAFLFESMDDNFYDDDSYEDYLITDIEDV